MLQRHIRADPRGDDWGCCPDKQVRPVQQEIVTSVHYKTSQAADRNPDAPYSTVWAPWSGLVSGRAPSAGSDDAVTAAAGLNAGGREGARWEPIYAVAASSVVVVVVVVTIIVALVAVLVRRRRRQNSASGSNSTDGHWNKKLTVNLAPTHSNLLCQQPNSFAPKAVSQLPKSPSAVGNQRRGYTPLPGTVYPAASASTKRRPDPNPYGLPPSQCSYQPERVRFVRVKRKRTIDSQAGDIDVGDNKGWSSSRQLDNGNATTSDLQALLPLTSLKSLFGVVSGVFGIEPAFSGTQQRIVDRRASIVPYADGPSASVAHLIGGRIDDASAGLSRVSNAVISSIEMGANASAEPPSSNSDPASATAALRSSSNDCESLSSGDTLDNVHTTSMATQSAAASDVDVVATSSDDTASRSTPSLRRSIGDKWSMDSDLSTRRQSALSTASTSFDGANRQTTTTTLERIGGLADAIGLGDLMRSVTGNQPPDTDKVEPFWVPPGLQIQKRRAQSLQSSSLPLSQFDATNANAKNGNVYTFTTAGSTLVRAEFEVLICVFCQSVHPVSHFTFGWRKVILLFSVCC